MSNEPATICVTDLMKRTISFFPSLRHTTHSSDTMVGDVLARIRRGTWSAPIQSVRDALRQQGKAAADGAKKKLPAVTFSGTFTKRENSGLKAHSGLLCMDFDTLGERLAPSLTALKADPHSIAIFKSPSGTGLKVLVAIDSNDHTAAFQSAERHYAELGLTADPTGKDVARLCYVSSDPDIWLREPAARVVVLSAPLHDCTICTPAKSADSAYSAQQSNAIDIRKARKALADTLAKTPRLARLYDQFVAGRVARAGERNRAMVDIVAGLYAVVAEPIVHQFVLLWFDVNRAIFHAAREEHGRECRAAIAGCAKTYRSKLAPIVGAYFDLLDEREQAAFRIARDLSNRSRTGIFFLSSDELGARLGCASMQAHRILNAFVGDGVLERVTPGQRREPGKQPCATEWRWHDSQPVIAPPALPAPNQS